jgi:hypothetical protein
LKPPLTDVSPTTDVHEAANWTVDRRATNQAR